MIGRLPASFAAAAGLALAPVTGDARVVIVPACGGASHHLLLVPDDPSAPGKEGDPRCAKACHAVNDRRGKSGGTEKRCC